MKGRANTLLVIVILAMASGVRPASAQSCPISTTDANATWSTTSVKVYIHSTTQSGVGPSVGLRYAINQGQLDTEYVVMRALHILNEEVGGRIKLQYAGTTSSSTNINGAIVLRSADVGGSFPDCSNAASGHPGAAAVASTVIIGGIRIRGQISFFRRNGPTCKFTEWSVDEDGALDVASVLMHELGHTFYAVNHPDENPVGCAYTSGWPTIMFSTTAAIGPGSRVVKDYDRAIFQSRHGTRTDFSSMYRSHKDVSAWQVPFAAASLGNKILYRPGSITQNVEQRSLGYLYQTGAPQVAGGGTPRSARYSQGSGGYLGVSGAIMRPVAAAARPGTSEVLIAYVERFYPSFGNDSEVGIVCYLKSTDAGATYGSPVCPSSSWLAHRNGLTAAYNAQANTFMIGFSGEDYTLRVGLVPALGSSFPNGIAQTLFSGSSIPFTSWHAPAIACSSLSNDCRIVWEQKSNAGCATEVRVAVVSFPSGLQILSQPDNAPCFPLFDTPGLAYNPLDDTFHMAMVKWNDTIYSYFHSSSVSDWAYNGNVWAVPNSFVLSPALGFRNGGYASRIQAWFVRYSL